MNMRKVRKIEIKKKSKNKNKGGYKTNTKLNLVYLLNPKKIKKIKMSL